MPQHHLYATDLDGTLLRSDATLSPYTIGVLNALLKRGELITFCTARSFVSASRLLEGVHWRLPCIVFNGAFIYDPVKGQNLISNLLELDVAKALLQEGAERGLVPFLYGREGEEEVLLHTRPRNQGQEMYLQHRFGDKRLRFVQELYLPQEIITIQYIASPDELHEYKAWAEDTFSDTLKLQFMEDCYLPGYYTLEFYHPHADKGLMLQKLTELVGAELHHTTVFGDNLNDLGMFAAAGFKAAVSNAHPLLQRQANTIIGANDEDGVARYLERLLLTS